MITILVVEDEQEVYSLLAQALRREGYSFINEPESGGLIKIIKKAQGSGVSSPGSRILDFNPLLLKDKEGLFYKSLLAEVEKPLIESVLEKTGGNQLKAAKMLGINRNTIRNKIKKLGINVTKWKI